MTTHTMTLAGLLKSGISVETHEAIAIAQQLIHEPAAAPPRPPFGPPTVDNVYVEADGSVACRACEVTPAASEIAILLQLLLESSAARAPGALRYTIARALLDVDAPPFDSIHEFSNALARFERGDRVEVVRTLVARASRPPAGAALVYRSTIDRRRLMPSATDLRRELRVVDAQLYAWQCREAALQEEILRRMSGAERPSPRRFLTLAVGAGLTLIASGELMHLHHAGVFAAAPSAVFAASPPPAPARSISEPAAAAQLTVFVPAAATMMTTSPLPKRAGRNGVQPVRSEAVNSTRTEASRVVVRRARQSSSKSFLSRFGLQWLRNVKFRSDL